MKEESLNTGTKFWASPEHSPLGAKTSEGLAKALLKSYVQEDYKGYNT